MQEELRPYLSLPAVTEGLFSLSSMLFDVNIHPADGLAPVITFCFNYSFDLPDTLLCFDLEHGSLFSRCGMGM